MLVAGVLLLQLLAQVLRVHLDVARLVGHLLRGVELRVDAWHGVDDLRGRQQGALLAVHELRQRPGHLLGAQLPDVLLAELLPDVRAVDRDLLVGEVLRLGIDRGGPVERLGGVPLLALALLVEAPQLFLLGRVLPDVGGIEGGVDQFLALPLHGFLSSARDGSSRAGRASRTLARFELRAPAAASRGPFGASRIGPAGGGAPDPGGASRAALGRLRQRGRRGFSWLDVHRLRRLPIGGRWISTRARGGEGRSGSTGGTPSLIRSCAP